MGRHYVSLKYESNGPFARPPDDIWVKMEHWCNDPDRENWEARLKSYPSANLFIGTAWTDHDISVIKHIMISTHPSHYLEEIQTLQYKDRVSESLSSISTEISAGTGHDKLSLTPVQT
jgi:hypothetical protein